MKKQKKRNCLKRIISVILMIALIVGVSWSDAFIKKVKANEIRNEEDVQEKNNQITNCDVFNLENGAIKTVISYKDGSRLETVYYADGNVVERMFNSLNEIVGTDTSNTVEIFEDLSKVLDVSISELLEGKRIEKENLFTVSEEHIVTQIKKNRKNGLEWRGLGRPG